MWISRKDWKSLSDQVTQLQRAQELTSTSVNLLEDFLGRPEVEEFFRSQQVKYVLHGGGPTLPIPSPTVTQRLSALEAKQSKCELLEFSNQQNVSCFRALLQFLGLELVQVESHVTVRKIKKGKRQ